MTIYALNCYKKLTIKILITRFALRSHHCEHMTKSINRSMNDSGVS